MLDDDDGSLTTLEDYGSTLNGQSIPPEGISFLPRRSSAEIEPQQQPTLPRQTLARSTNFTGNIAVCYPHRDRTKPNEQHTAIQDSSPFAACLPHAEHSMATDDLPHAVDGAPQLGGAARAGTSRLPPPAVLQHEAGAH